MDDIYTLKRFKKVKQPNYNTPLLVLVLLLIFLIGSKKDPNLKSTIEKKVFNSNFSFAKINEIYKKYAGEVLPNLKKEELVFDEKLNYTSSTPYKDGVSLKLENNLIPINASGLVVFIGPNDDYGSTVIIQQTDGVDLMYGNLDEVNVKLYDYVESGSLLGTSLDSNLFLVYKKEGNILNYEDYIKS